MAPCTTLDVLPVIRALLGTPWRRRDGTMEVVTPIRAVRGGLVHFSSPTGERFMLVQDFHEMYEPVDHGRHTSPWDWVLEDDGG